MEENERQADEELISQAEEFIEINDIVEAQNRLDAVSEKNGRWHYIQGRVYLQMNWTNEARKQFELALKDEPQNRKYKKALKKIKDFDGGKSLLNAPANEKGDGYDLAQCCCEVSCEGCCVGICEGICSGS